MSVPSTSRIRVLLCALCMVSLPNSAEAYVPHDNEDLSGKDLRMSLFDMDLGEVKNLNFTGANLEGAEICDCIFTNACFKNANLRQIRPVSYFFVDGCDFTGADITGSDFRLTAKQLCSTKNYKEKDLSNTIVHGDFSGVSFAGFNLRGAGIDSDFKGCDFTDADITGATLTRFASPMRFRGGGQPFAKQQLVTTKNFKQKNLDGTTLHGMNLDGLDFSGFNLGTISECSIKDVDFTNADFIRPRSRSIQPREPTRGFIRCDLTKEQFESTSTFKGKYLRCMRFEYMNLDGWDFSRMDLRYTSFKGSSLKGAKFERSNIECADFSMCTGLTAKQLMSTVQGELLGARFDLSKYPIEGKRSRD